MTEPERRITDAEERAPKQILVVVAHPDDETLGCGGAIARAMQEGEQVTVLTFTDGVSSRADSRPADHTDRLIAFARALEQLGVWSPGLLTDYEGSSYMYVNERLVWRHLQLPDQRLQSEAQIELAQYVEAVIQEVEPHYVLTHSATDLNLDHVMVHYAVRAATRPIADGRWLVNDVLAFEVPSSTEWGTHPFAPNIFIDIQHELDRKIAAMACYGQESRTAPHPRAPESLRALATMRGSQSGYKAAEAFQLIMRRR